MKGYTLFYYKFSLNLQRILYVTILYGSYANGKPTTDSDIDIAVISSSFNNKNLLKRQELLGEAIFAVGEPVEAIGYSYKEFVNRSRLSFLFDIVSNGKTVYQE